MISPLTLSLSLSLLIVYNAICFNELSYESPKESSAKKKNNHS